MSQPGFAPSVDQLGGFLLGTLSEPEAERMAAWVNQNRNAIEALRAVPAHDALTGDLAAARTLPPPTPEVQRILQAVTQPPAFGLTQAPTTPELVQVGQYCIVRELGRGGMGVVYEARDERLGRRAAIKVLGPTLAGDATYRERFLREARAVANLKSDHVVTVYQADESEGVLYLAMEYLEGSTLGEWGKQRAGRLTTEEVVSVARTVLKGLSVAHAAGIVHRDIKPGNLWVERDTGRVKVLDFGLAHGPDSGPTITPDGRVCGTPEYMAPEQVDGKRVDCRADLFSLGVVLYHLVSGESPFRRETVWATLAAVNAVELPRLTGVSGELSRFIARLLSKNPDQRPQDATAALAELDALASRVSLTRVDTPKRRWRHLVAAAGFAAVVALGIIIIIIQVNPRNPQEPRADGGDGLKDKKPSDSGGRKTSQSPRSTSETKSTGNSEEIVEGTPVLVTTSTHGFENLAGDKWRDNETIQSGWTGTVLSVDKEKELNLVRFDKYPKEPAWIDRTLLKQRGK